MRVLLPPHLQGCVMALVMSYRSVRLHEEQGEALEQLATTVEVSRLNARLQACSMLSLLTIAAAANACSNQELPCRFTPGLCWHIPMLLARAALLGVLPPLLSRSCTTSGVPSGSFRRSCRTLMTGPSAHMLR